MPQLTQDQFLLSEIDNQIIFDRYISPRSLRNSTSVTNPTALFLGGQPGSGKSGLAQYQLKQFADRGGVVLINSDALREYHPAFANLQRTDADRASFLVNPDTVIWQQKLINAAVGNKRNLLLDGTLGGNPAPILATMKRLRSAGYTIQVSVLAVPAEQSRLGIYRRYEDQLTIKGAGRWVGMETHNRVFNEIPQNLALFQQQLVVDQIHLYARPKGSGVPEELYSNTGIAGEWQAQPEALVRLKNYRERKLTEIEQTEHKYVTEKLLERMTLRGASQPFIDGFLATVNPPDYHARLATADDAQLYFEWANDPATRQQSFNSEPITWENHVTWFTRKLADPNALLLVFEVPSGDPIGQVRFEKRPDGEVIIGISLDAFFRGKGLASTLIRAGVGVCRERWGSPATAGHAIPISAYIKPENVASIRAFERAGFHFDHESRKFGVNALCLTFNIEQI
ncbi:GNAT family N-acetyltransferase [Fibrella sp. HMF5335]|uniref:GNAT family N-acetyltransferase n=1 Tax=Fibrella rubiginis TaxID=2817060 RepID=A0A939GL35_9BACT|nr:GNAT family N-acetyltransferase [Fibrella rubiginis]MBO0939410.1 GNAT family N-acetyltransferase [Fibrella rubiginis]